MCGIYGVVSKDQSFFNQSFNSMGDLLVHRGPDGKGKYQVQLTAAQVYFGHVRLAILDLTDNSLQPMHTLCQNYTLIYNGEIYNYLELKQELIKLGCTFRTQSDTEVVLQAIIHWGADAFKKFNGMWALAFLDKKKEQLWFSRDRFGVKPLYYAQINDTLYFSSEVKAILKGANRTFNLNKKTIYHFLTNSLVEHDENTFFEDIVKVPPASYLIVNLRTLGRIESHNFKRFWDYPVSHNMSYSLPDALEEMDRLFTDAVNVRLRSDVPVGVTLSGGVDSSSIACKMKQLLNQQSLHSFSIISNDGRFNEGEFIKKINTNLNTVSYQLNVSERVRELFESYQKATWHNDQPLLSFSSLGFYSLMKAANKQGIKVILSGQGADEILCGYRKYAYYYLYNLIREGNPIAAASKFFQFINNSGLLTQFNYHDAKRYFPAWMKTQKKSYLSSDLLNLKLQSPLTSKKTILARQIQDMSSTSVPALLHYEDRLSMAEGVEIRLPFLDYRLVEFCLQLPTNLKLRSGWSKWILREAMSSIVPQDVIWRKDKKGFSIPQDKWFKEDLYQNVSDVFNQPMLAEELNLVNSNIVKTYYNEFCNEKNEVSFKDVYNPFALEIWLKQYSDFIAA